MSYARRCLLDLLGPAGDEDDLIGQVEDDRAHAEAEKLRETGRRLADAAPNAAAEGMSDGYLLAARDIDPYEMRGGQLVRKSDGKPVTL